MLLDMSCNIKIMNTPQNAIRHQRHVWRDDTIFNFVIFILCVTPTVQNSMLNVHASGKPIQPMKIIASLLVAKCSLHRSAITQWWKVWAVPMPFHSRSERNTYRMDIKEVQLYLYDNHSTKCMINARLSFNTEFPFKPADSTDAFVFEHDLRWSDKYLFQVLSNKLMNGSRQRRILHSSSDLNP